MRTIREEQIFSPEDLMAMAQISAKLSIIGPRYHGEFHSQEVAILPDGSIRVITIHTPERTP